jgi:hypothetical protein
MDNIINTNEQTSIFLSDFTFCFDFSWENNINVLFILW